MPERQIGAKTIYINNMADKLFSYLASQEEPVKLGQVLNHLFPNSHITQIHEYIREINAALNDQGLPADQILEIHHNNPSYPTKITGIRINLNYTNNDNY